VFGAVRSPAAGAHCVPSWARQRPCGPPPLARAEREIGEFATSGCGALVEIKLHEKTTTNTRKTRKGTPVMIVGVEVSSGVGPTSCRRRPGKARPAGERQPYKENTDEPEMRDAPPAVALSTRISVCAQIVFEQAGEAGDVFRRGVCPQRPVEQLGRDVRSRGGGRETIAVLPKTLVARSSRRCLK